MDPATLSPGFPLVFLLSVFGWGGLGRLFCDRRLFRFHALQAILGLALLNVAGGALNLLGLAKSAVLMVLMLVGAALGFSELWKSRPWRNFPRGLKSAPVFIALGFAFAADFMLSKSEVFNLHDDFHTYAVRPVRMVETGSMGGNAFDPLGLDSLGSQSFFHGFFLWGTDIRFLNGFDAVACFALCLLLAAELSMRWRLPWVTGALAVLCVAVINPQYVNISPLYSGVAAIMALVVCGVFLGRSLAFGRARKDRRAEFTLALLAAWLLTLKITLAMFGALCLGLFYVFMLARGRNRVEILKSAAITAGAAVMLALPWVLVPLPALMKARNLGLQLKAGATVSAQYPSMAGHDIPAMFSTAPLLYGDRPLSFLFLVVYCAGMGLLCAWVWLKHGEVRRSASGIAIAAAGLAVPAVFFALGHIFPLHGAIRYSCPMLIGVFTATALGYLRSKDHADSKMPAFAVSGCMVAAILVFSGTFWLRAQEGAADRTLIAFQVNSKHADYSRKLVSLAEGDYQRSIQALMPPRTSALVWTVAPFQLDYSRNRLLTLSTFGMINPALQFPAGVDSDSFEKYLRGNGIQFVLMETNGYAANKLQGLQELRQSPYAVYQKMADFGIYLRSVLLDLAQRNPVRYSDDRMLLFELKDTPADRPQVTR